MQITINNYTPKVMKKEAHRSKKEKKKINNIER